MLGFPDMGSEGGGVEEPDRPILADEAAVTDALEGPLTSPDREEAVHWVTVYEELIEVGRQFLDGLQGAPAPAESTSYDRTRVEARLRHFDARRLFWLEVLNRLEPLA